MVNYILGYYRVNYDDVLWRRIINALQDEEQREKIHPLNRASVRFILCIK